ncbi:unnamed protein product [Cylindrotheca closterium]|uniref:Uncharacterized protein n=1 Tax=Cylindrotheca closterium TaxID=2856 RepID=A0AAD2JJ90_9STRA|nr:unnamed protein product [Cylindrotheca closterium]
MAAAIPVFTIYDAMILCQIPDTGNFQGQTDAQRMAEELFDNNFGTAMTKSIKQVNMDLATLASLTAVQGRIVSRPRAQDRIRAFVQWVRDEIRMGRNPAQHPFPAGDTSTLLQRLNFHQKYVKDSKTLIDNTVPPKWSKEQQWKQWVKLLRDHLRAYIGVNGIPLVYVVRENAAQDPTPQDDFLDNYINMALLVGTAFIVDNKQVLALLNKFIMGCSEAEMVIQALNTTTDDRAAFFALKAFYEGEKCPAMYWQKFEQILNNAYATMHHEYGRVMYTDIMKLQSLQQRIKADFLSQTKAAIEANMHAIPMTMSYDQAMRMYRSKVSEKFPPASVAAVAWGRHVRENNRNTRGGGRGGGRGQGGRNHHNNSRNNRRYNGNRQQHPDERNITLSDGKVIKYHPSYNFSCEHLDLMTQDQRNTMTAERTAYRNQNKNNQDNASTNENTRNIAALNSLVGDLTNRLTVPTEITQDTADTQISQVTTGTNGRSIIGGRLQQAQQRQNGGSGTTQRLGVQEPVAGTYADNEMDTNADTCCLSSNFIITAYTQRSADVYAYDSTLPPMHVPIVSGATAYDCPETGSTFILIINEALYYGNKLDHSLFNPNQIQSYGTPLWNNPYNDVHEIGIEATDLFTPLLSRGTKLLFGTRAPTKQELEKCHHNELTSKVPWEPSTVQLGKLSTRRNIPFEDPRSNESEMRSLDPVQHNLQQWRVVQQINATADRFQDVPVRPSFVSTERHSKVTAENLSERLGISIGQARATLNITLQRGTRSAIMPLARTY